MSNDEKDKLFNLVTSLMKDESWDETISTLKSRLDLVENHSDLSWNLGWAFFKIGDLENAVKYLSQSVRLGPNKAVTHWALANALTEKGELAEAETEFIASLSLKDTDSARIGLAFLYLSQGLVEKAERTHLEGIGMAPSSKERLEAYADFLSDIGREAESKQQYAKAAQLPPE